MGKALNLKNQKFGKLTAIKKVGRDKNKNIMWLCKCDCGKEASVVGRDLKNGHTKSCGCLKKHTKPMQTLNRRTTKKQGDS